MDIILEVVDTLVLDRVYATLAPASSSQYLYQKVSNVASSTFSSVREGATPAPQYTYIYEPATRLFSLEPTEWAYKSSWPRDNVFRQGISLFAIVWYVSSTP
jgi:Delta7-sterol 5-desaturase